MIGAPAVITDGGLAGHVVKLDILHENAPRRCQKRQWPVALSYGWMPNWVRTRHQRRVARERVKRGARVRNRERGRVVQLYLEVAVGERRVEGTRGAMNVVGPTFTAVSKSPTVGQGRGPELQDGRMRKETERREHWTCSVEHSQWQTLCGIWGMR